MLALGGTSASAAPATRPAKSPKPTTATPLQDCASADCHADVLDHKVLHGPAASDDCDACHHLTDPVNHTFQPWREKAELCTFCHEFDDAVTKPVVHKPVQTGECLGCHNPHGGPEPSLMREDSMAQLCGRCHDVKAMDRHFMHAPVKDGDCDACHQPHASKFPKLVDAAGADLCLFCHREFKAEFANATFVHKAVDDPLSCNACHDVHGSDFPNQVSQPISDLCLGCHDTIKTEMSGSVPHPAVAGDRACITCHTAHGGDLSSLMADRPDKVCMSCHKQPVKDAKGKIILPAMAELLDPNAVKHGPVDNGECGGCHNIHGGDRADLLRKTNTSRFYETFSRDKYEMCFDCHDERLVEQSFGNQHTEFRNGSRNLHYLHVSKDPQRGRNCTVCHATHASPQEQIVRPTVPFGKWPLPIAYTKTETGGSCDTGCHKTWSYDRVSPVANAAPSALIDFNAMIWPIIGHALDPADARPGSDDAQPVAARWDATDASGQLVRVPDEAGRATILLFLRDNDLQGGELLETVAGVVRGGEERGGAQVAVVLCGPTATARAVTMRKSSDRLDPDWPIIADPDYVLSRRHGVQVWPATLLVRADATVALHTAGAPLSLAAELSAHLDHLAGRINADTLRRRLSQTTTVADGAAERAAWHLQMAEKLLASKRPAEARKMISDGLRLAPDHWPLRLAMADALLQLDQPRQARELLIKLPKDAPIPTWRKNLLLAKVAIAQQNIADAKRLLQQVITDNPALPEPHVLLARLYEQETDWQSAAREYKAAEEARSASRV